MSQLYKIIVPLFIAILFLTCEDEPAASDDSVTITIVEPNDTSTLQDSVVQVVATLGDPDIPSYVQIDINSSPTFLSPADTMRMAYIPNKSDSDIDLVITADAMDESGKSLGQDIISLLYTSTSSPADDIEFVRCDASGENCADFQMMRYPTTNQQYLRYLNIALTANNIYISDDSTKVKGLHGIQDGLNHPSDTYVLCNLQKSRIGFDGEVLSIESGYEEHPVVAVSWYGAKAFAHFYGMTLPSIEQYEYASEGGDNWTYPFGDGSTIDNQSANFSSAGTTEVGAFDGRESTTNAVSFLGAYDLAGNVSEWLDNTSANQLYTLYTSGSFASGSDMLAIGNYSAESPSYTNNFIGFRCVASDTYNAPAITGCGDQESCRYFDAWASDIDNSLCNYIDCSGECGGSSELDECDICDTDLENNSYFVSSSDFGGAYDCNGVCGGSAEIDFCDTCVGGDTGVESCGDDCAGVSNGLAEIDSCGVCSGGTTDHTADSDKDCNGECFGSAQTDSCSVCYGGGSNVSDADSLLDDCNDCCNSECILAGNWNGAQDCAGVCDGDAQLDLCDACNGTCTSVPEASESNSSSGACYTWNGGCYTCAGVLATGDESDAYYNPCEICGIDVVVGEDTEFQPIDGSDDNCEYDCMGAVEAEDCSDTSVDGCAFVNECGECVGGSSGIEDFNEWDTGSYGSDCAGVCSGAAEVDDCGCVGGDTGLESGWCYGCTDFQATNFYCDGSPGNSTYCCDTDYTGDYSCQSSTTNNTSNFNECGASLSPSNDSECVYFSFFSSYVVSFPEQLIDDGSCIYTGCADPLAMNYFCYDETDSDVPNAYPCDSSVDEYGSDAIVDDGSCEYPEAYISLVNFSQENNSVDILIQNDEPIGGFQFTIEGASISIASGGTAEENGFMVSSSSSTIIGFNLSGGTIPSADDAAVLVNVSFTSTSDNICLSGVTLSNAAGTALDIVNLNSCD